MKRKLLKSEKSPVLPFMIFCVILALYFVNLQEPLSDGHTATMVINFDGQNRRAFKGPVMEDMTVLEALFAATQNNPDLRVTYYVDPNGDVVLSAIDGRMSLISRQWKFYVNEVQIKSEDINKIYVKAGDLLEVKYE